MHLHLNNLVLIGHSATSQTWNQKFDSKDYANCHHHFLFHMTFCIVFYFHFSNHWKPSFTKIWCQWKIWCHCSKLMSKQWTIRASGWLSQLNIRLWLRSWTCSSWVQAPHGALCWQRRSWSLLWILRLPLSLPLPCLPSVSLCLSKIDKH